ncbi:MAG: hypothetical protein JRL30_02805 [Deltaproteobacteria bacterium]|nr:hypothetical protein [Deltaproteobacteria bacterium]
MHTTANVSKWVADIRFLSEKPSHSHSQDLVKLNTSLERDARLSRLNETLLEKRLHELEGIGCVRGAAYGLTLARINELALLCAGTYADHCEVQGVGDLLFNPRHILVYIKGMPTPVVKKRHTPLTEQFANVAGTREGVIAWLRDETLLETREKALLPHLYDQLQDVSVISPQYLNSVNARTRKIAALTGFLASARFFDGLAFHQWLQHTGAAETRWIASRLCSFDTRIFFDLGNDIQQILRPKAYGARFFRQKTCEPLRSIDVGGLPFGYNTTHSGEERAIT